jgi:hypothetical protein
MSFVIRQYLTIPAYLYLGTSKLEALFHLGLHPPQNTTYAEPECHARL